MHTSSEQPQISPEDLVSRIEAQHQDSTQEVDQMKEDWDRSAQRHYDNLKTWTRSRLEHRVDGLKSFARHVEEYIGRQHSSEDRASALESGSSQIRGKTSREHRDASVEQPSRASGSVTQLLDYVSMPEPPGIPAPPIPSDTPQSDAQPATATHFSTLRSEVRAGAIRVDISNPEQWCSHDSVRPASSDTQPKSRSSFRISKVIDIWSTNA